MLLPILSWDASLSLFFLKSKPYIKAHSHEAYNCFCGGITSYHKFWILKQCKILVSQFCRSEVLVGSAGSPAPGFTRPKSRCWQGSTRVTGEECTSKIIHVVSRTHFLEVVGLRFPFPCGLVAMCWFLLLEATHIHDFHLTPSSPWLAESLTLHIALTSPLAASLRLPLLPSAGRKLYF